MQIREIEKNLRYTAIIPMDEAIENGFISGEFVDENKICEYIFQNNTLQALYEAASEYAEETASDESPIVGPGTCIAVQEDMLYVAISFDPDVSEEHMQIEYETLSEMADTLKKRAAKNIVEIHLIFIEILAKNLNFESFDDDEDDDDDYDYDDRAAAVIDALQQKLASMREGNSVGRKENKQEKVFVTDKPETFIFFIDSLKKLTGNFSQVKIYIGKHKYYVNINHIPEKYQPATAMLLLESGFTNSDIGESVLNEHYKEYHFL